LVLLLNCIQVRSNERRTIS